MKEKETQLHLLQKTQSIQQYWKNKSKQFYCRPFDQCSVEQAFYFFK